MRTQNVQELVTYLKDHETNSRDFIAQRQKLFMTIPATPEGQRPVPMLQVGENVTMQLNRWSHSQLAQKLSIPQQYYDKMLEEEPFLLAKNVNTWLTHDGKDDKTKLLVRTTGDTVRAILSDRYKPIGNQAVLFATLDTLNTMPDVRFTVRDASVSDTTMYLRITSDNVYLMNPSLVFQDHPERNGDPMFPGLIVRNSEVGASRFQADVFAWREWCKNGAVVTQGISKVHIGRKIGGEGEINFSERTEELDIATTLSAMKDVVNQVFDLKRMEELMARIRQGQEIEIDEPVQAVENFLKEWKLPDSMKDDILARFGEKSQYGLGNAITEYARDQDDPDKQVKLEEIGGEILTLGAEEFKKAVVRSVA